MDWRFLEPNDFKWMMDVSVEHHAESDWSEVKYDEEKVAGYVNSIINDPNYFGIVATEDEKRIGFIAGVLLEYSFSHEKFAKELEVYVVPEERTKMTGIFLMKKFMDWAKMNGVREIYFEPRLSDNEIKKFDAMAKRLGMSHIANVYRRQF